MTKTYRRGALGALVDEYERAANELGALVASLTDDEYAAICDPDTEDEACRSFQLIASHVVRAGFGYATAIRNALGIETAPPEQRVLSRAEAVDGLSAVIAFTEETLDGRWGMTDDEIDAVKVPTGFKPTFDLETILEHAICHVLRHRRQIERLRSVGS